jgi:hypothetical protein
MITNNISWSLGPTPNKSLVCLEPTAVGLVTSLLFRFTSRVTHSQNRQAPTAYIAHPFPPALQPAPSPTDRPIPARTDRTLIAPDRSQTPQHQSQSTLDRFLKSLPIHRPLAPNTCNTKQPFPIATDRSDRFFNSNQNPQHPGPFAHRLSPIAYRLSPIAYCLLPIAHCLLPIAHCLLPIAYCLLPIAYCPSPLAQHSSPVRKVHKHSPVPACTNH